jgi:hypothetical protein
MNRLTLEKKANSKGVIFALVASADPKETNGFEVWKLCENYDGKVKGGIRKTWRYIDKDMSRQEAEHLYNKKTSN